MLTTLFFIGCVCITFSAVGLLFRALLFPVKIAIALFVALLAIPFFLLPIFALPLIFFLLPLKMVLVGVGIGYLVARRRNLRGASC